MRIAGRLFDSAGEPVPDGVVETWQADPPVREDFRGFARCPTAEDGSFFVVTLMPGPVAGPGAAQQAPHLDVSVLARGLLHRVVTRIYFSEHGDANANDAILMSVPADRRATLVAQQGDDGYRFDIHLQGDRETVFFAV
jgi:protocatechuate 3,4-dioxygenase alpha subunit